MSLDRRMFSTRRAEPADTALWRTCRLGEIRVRMVEYEPGYRGHYSCERDHVLLCVSGVLRAHLPDRRVVVLGPGSSQHLEAADQPHRVHTETGATVVILD